AAGGEDRWQGWLVWAGSRLRARHRGQRRGQPSRRDRFGGDAPALHLQARTRSQNAGRRDQQGSRRRLRHARLEEPAESRQYDGIRRHCSTIHGRKLIISTIYLFIKSIKWTI